MRTAAAALIAATLAANPGPIPGAHAASSTETSPAPRAAPGWTPRLGEALPLAAPFVDESGRTIALGELFGQRPVALVLGYYRCPNLCTTLTEGVLETLRESALPAGSYEVVAVSIDPAEDATIAARRKAAYGPWLRDTAAHVHLLTGTAGSIAALVQAAGLRYSVEESHRSVESSRVSVETRHAAQDARAFAHPAGFLVITPQGRIAQYFPGVRFDPRAARLALIDASRGGIGSLADRLVLLCSHYDPATGRYTLRVMQAVRVLGLLSVALLAAFIWHLTYRRRR